MSNEILDNIKKAIEGYKDNPEWEEIGTIIEVGDGIVKISGLTKVASQEVLEIETEKEKGRLEDDDEFDSDIRKLLNMLKQLDDADTERLHNKQLIKHDELGRGIKKRKN